MCLLDTYKRASECLLGLDRDFKAGRVTEIPPSEGLGVSDLGAGRKTRLTC